VFVAFGPRAVRVDPEQSADLVESTPARMMEMRGRGMRGWLVVDSRDLSDDQELSRWVDRGVSYARSLPAKR
jgi:hypothetical protein